MSQQPSTCCRCLKRTDGIHTCTPSAGWRKLEQERDQLLKALKELLSGQTIEGLRGYTGMMDICVTGDDVRAGLEVIAAVEQSASDADGWIEWSGGECPVGDDARVEIRFRNGSRSATNWMPSLWRWTWGAKHSAGDIIAYRVVQSGAA